MFNDKLSTTFPFLKKVNDEHVIETFSLKVKQLIQLQMLLTVNLLKNISIKDEKRGVPHWLSQLNVCLCFRS